MRVLIDPGHGGPDPGAIGPKGTHEASVAWDYAKMLYVQLRADDHDPMMSRSSNEDPSQSLRVRRANEFDAELAISCHCNGYHLPTAHGAEVLYWHSSTRSQALATSLRAGLEEMFPGLKMRGVKPRHHGGRGSRFLRDTKMPAVIVEPMFITHPVEEVELSSIATQESIAAALAAALS